MPGHTPLVSPLRSATRIVATVGPASSSERVLRRMMQAGVDVFRFNMSHGSHETHATTIARVRKVASAQARPVGILVDLQGPKIRTRENEGGGRIALRRGEIIELTGGPGPSRPGRIVVDFPRLVSSLAPADEILLDDGKLVLRVNGVRGTVADVGVVRGGQLKERAGVNVPGRTLAIEIPTAKDRRDAAFALEQQADFVALSFVQSARDVARLRRFLSSRVPGKGSQARSSTAPTLPGLVAKIEKPAALDDLDAILGEADGVMVARGDLGVELSLERVPIWQKEILCRARGRGVFTITATQMLESMITSESPTRAEVSDVATAIFDGTDAVMLSAETATGEHPVEAVRTLSRVAAEVESKLPRFGYSTRLPADARASDPVDAVVHAGAALAVEAGARWILVFTLRGRTVPLLTRHRPHVGIVAVSPHEATRRRLCLAWNTRTMRLSLTPSTDRLMRRGLDQMTRAGLVKNGDLVVIVAGDAGTAEATNLLRLVRIGG